MARWREESGGDHGSGSARRMLRLVDIDLPEVGATMCWSVQAAALSPYDWHIMRGDPLGRG